MILSVGGAVLTHNVRLLSSVDAQVTLQSLQVAETGATGVTRVRFLTCVDQDVCPEVSNLLQKNKSEMIRFLDV